METDYNTGKGIDIHTGKLMKEYRISAASMLNDIAVDSKGNLYITDTGTKLNKDEKTKATSKFMATGTDAVYKIDVKGTIAQLAAGAHLDHPNGIAVSPEDDVYFVTEGGFIFFTATRRNDTGVYQNA